MFGFFVRLGCGCRFLFFDLGFFTRFGGVLLGLLPRRCNSC